MSTAGQGRRRQGRNGLPKDREQMPDPGVNLLEAQVKLSRQLRACGAGSGMEPDEEQLVFAWAEGRQGVAGPGFLRASGERPHIPVEFLGRHPSQFEKLHPICQQIHVSRHVTSTPDTDSGLDEAGLMNPGLTRSGSLCYS